MPERHGGGEKSSRRKNAEGIYSSSWLDEEFFLIGPLSERQNGRKRKTSGITVPERQPRLVAQRIEA